MTPEEQEFVKYQRMVCGRLLVGGYLVDEKRTNRLFGVSSQTERIEFRVANGCSVIVPSLEWKATSIHGSLAGVILEDVHFLLSEVMVEFVIQLKGFDAPLKGKRITFVDGLEGCTSSFYQVPGQALLAERRHKWR